MSRTNLAHPTIIVLLINAVLGYGTATSAEDTSPDECQQRLAKNLPRRVGAYRETVPKAGNVLRVVYFHPADVEPQKDHQERITRIMLDIQDFYRSEMKRNGFGDRTFPLEMKGDELTIHLVKGKDPAAQYRHESGGNVRREVQAAFADRMSLDREYALIFNGMCRKLGENRYFFHAPYYGDSRSNHRRGLCHVADCELMDTLHLTDVKNRIQYEEHYGKRDQTLAEFNTFYLGGIAHELGHGLGLPHNREKKRERQRRGTALMGGGNLTYRRERWNGKGSFLTLASCTRLASHPLFTGSNHGRAMDVRSTIASLKFDARGQTLLVSGQLQANIDAYAAIAYTNPRSERENPSASWINADYDALAWVSEVKDGVFAIDACDHRPGQYALRLTFCHVNGATSNYTFSYHVNPNGEPLADELNGSWHLQRAERAFMDGRKEEAARLAEAALPHVVGMTAEPKLKHLIDLTKGRTPRDPAKVAADSVYLSELQWVTAEVGWGKPCRDQYYCDERIRDAIFLELDGVFYKRGLYAHAPSRYVFALQNKWNKFEATVGLQQGVGPFGSAVFIMKGNGKVLYQSELVKGNKTVDVSVHVQGVDTLELLVESGKQGNARCWAVWGDPRLSR